MKTLWRTCLGVTSWGEEVPRSLWQDRRPSQLEVTEEKDETGEQKHIDLTPTYL